MFVFWMLAHLMLRTLRLTSAPMPAQPVVDVNVTPATPPAEAQNTEPKQDTNMIPKARFDEVNKALRELQRQQQEREENERKAADQRAKEQGEWQKLAEQREQVVRDLAPKAERASRLETIIATYIDEQSQDFPEELRDFDPGPNDLEQRWNWMNKGRALAAKLSSKTQVPPQEQQRAAVTMIEQHHGGSGQARSIEDDFITQRNQEREARPNPLRTST